MDINDEDNFVKSLDGSNVCLNASVYYTNLAVMEACLKAGADIVGVNCLRNPETTLPLMREVRDAVSGFVGCQPVAYRTPAHQHDFTALKEFPLGLDPLQLSRKEMADYALEAQDIGIDYIGSCCGSVACHVKAMAIALGKRSGDERHWRSRTDKPMSAYEYHEQSESAE